MTQYNDDLMAILRKLGYEPALNDALKGMYGNLGYEGAMNDIAKGVRDSLGSTEMFPVSTYLRTFNGTTAYGTLNDPLVLTTGDKVEVEFSTTVSGVLRDLLGGVLQFDIGDLIQLTNCTATIDGTAIADGASISSYLDSTIHKIVLTMTGADTITYIGQNGAAANYYSGEILSVKATISGVVTNYVPDNDSTTTTYARGQASPSAKYITWSNFTASDIEKFTYNVSATRWEGVDRIVNGGFDAATDWTLTDPALTISGGLLHCDGTQIGTETAYQNLSAHFDDGERCLVTYSMVERTAGQVRPRINALFGTYESTVRVHAEVVEGAAWTVTGLGVDINFNGSIDNVSVRRVLEYN